MQADLETVQQSARARGTRVRIECDDLFETRTFTLLDSADRPTQLCDVSLATIAEELAKPELWAQLEPTWKSLVAKSQQQRSPQIQYRPGPLKAQWAAMEAEALKNSTGTAHHLIVPSLRAS